MSYESQCWKVYGNHKDQELKWEPQKVEALKENEVLIQSRFSSINFKDALAITGKGPILRKFPLTPGIDVAGVVVESLHPSFKEGDSVLVNGCGLGENEDGGYANFVRFDGDHVVPLPNGLSLLESMTLGTAGFTAALCLHRMLRNGQCPDMGPILVNGASGGVGQLATQIFSSQGYEVHALSRKKELYPYLKEIGAKNCGDWESLQLGSKPLESIRFGGAVDNLGGEFLTKIAAHIQLWGNVCCVGLAASSRFEGSVMPLILRGVSFLGISSNNTPGEVRRDLWQRLAKEWKPSQLSKSRCEIIPPEDIPSRCERIMRGENIGRIVVDMANKK